MGTLQKFTTFQSEIEGHLKISYDQVDKESIWALIPKTNSRLQNIPDNGYTFTAFQTVEDKPDIVPFTTDEEIVIGVVSKEMLQILLNRIDCDNAKSQDKRPFKNFEGIALCYGPDCIVISVYKYVNKRRVRTLYICGDGSGGDNLTPCRIPAN